MKYNLPCSWEVYGRLEVEADSLEEAIEKARDDSRGLPQDFYYVDGSFEVDTELAEEEYE